MTPEKKIHLHCTIGPCDWKSKWGGSLEHVMAQYLAHAIRDHWDILQYAHDNPAHLDMVEGILRS